MCSNSLACTFVLPSHRGFCSVLNESFPFLSPTTGQGSTHSFLLFAPATSSLLPARALVFPLRPQSFRIFIPFSPHVEWTAPFRWDASLSRNSGSDSSSFSPPVFTFAGPCGLKSAPGFFLFRTLFWPSGRPSLDSIRRCSMNSPSMPLFFPFAAF